MHDGYEASVEAALGIVDQLLKGRVSVCHRRPDGDGLKTQEREQWIYLII